MRSHFLKASNPVSPSTTLNLPVVSLSFFPLRDSGERAGLSLSRVQSRARSLSCSPSCSRLASSDALTLTLCTSISRPRCRSLSLIFSPPLSPPGHSLTRIFDGAHASPSPSSIDRRSHRPSTALLSFLRSLSFSPFDLSTIARPSLTGDPRPLTADSNSNGGCIPAWTHPARARRPHEPFPTPPVWFDACVVPVAAVDCELPDAPVECGTSGDCGGCARAEYPCDVEYPCTVVCAWALPACPRPDDAGAPVRPCACAW